MSKKFDYFLLLIYFHKKRVTGQHPPIRTHGGPLLTHKCLHIEHILIPYKQYFSVSTIIFHFWSSVLINLAPVSLEIISLVFECFLTLWNKIIKIYFTHFICFLPQTQTQPIFSGISICRCFERK